MPEFCQGPPAPSPNPRPSIDLWLLSTDHVGAAALATLEDCLSPPEQAQLAKIRFPQAQRQFLLSRGCLRHLLSRYTGQAPADLAFVYGSRGKPALNPRGDGAGLAPRFNLSHSGQRLLVAISGAERVRAIGVDLEILRPVSLLPGLCRRCLTPAEAETVLALPTPEADHRFLRYWTGKEACLKALGVGITDSLQSLELSLGPEALTAVPVAVAVVAPTLPEYPGQLYQWQPDEQYLAAVAVQSTSLEASDFCRYQATPQDLLAGAAMSAL
jgi:4'-phosphopantetheinyl transferase